MLTQLIAILILSVILYGGSWFAIRALARIPFRWTFNPANTVALIVTEEDGSGDGMSGGGNIVNTLHAVPGMTLVKTEDTNQMNWYFEEGEDPEHQNFLFQELGVQDMGGWFYTTRWNIDKRLRFARDEEVPEEELHTVTKAKKTRHVFYSGEMTVKIIGADTSDKLGLNMEIDFAFVRKYPVRSILHLADSTAFLTSMVQSLVNIYTVDQPAAYYYGGEQVGANREKLAEDIDNDEDFEKAIENELGLTITRVSIRDVDMSPEHKALYSLKVKAEKEGEEQVIRATKAGDAAIAAAERAATATIAEATAKKTAGILANDVVADRFERILKPAAETEETVIVFRSDREAAAYENNKTVTTFAPGSNTQVPLGH